MGPLSTYGLVDPGWSLIIIFAIGIAFGLVLEQSGFSSSRKLAGVFYGYDFVVLKVFFTAGITAMAGLVIMGYFGLIDLEAIYINSNFLSSAVTGGVIMGFGFILGGFCPGTSVTGAMIGKIDAWVFIAGIFLGIFVFGAFFDSFKPLFSGYYFDGELISSTLGLPKHLFVVMMIFMALAAFAVGAFFEKKATRGLKPTNKVYSSYAFEIFVVIILAGVIFFLPQRSAKQLTINSEKKVLEYLQSPRHLMTTDEFAYALLNNIENLTIIDVRTEASYNEFSFPGSANIPFSLLAEPRYSDLLADSEKRIVLVSNGGVEASRAQIICFRMGYTNVRVLEGGINGLINDLFYDNTLPEGSTDYEKIYKYRFRQKAAETLRNDTMRTTVQLPVLPKAAPIINVSKAAGGC